MEATKEEKVAWKRHEITQYILGQLSQEREEAVSSWLSGGSEITSEYWRGAIVTLDAVVSRIDGILSEEETE